MPLEHGIDIDRRSKFRLDGNTGNLDAVGRQTQRLHMDFIILLRHKIPIESPRNPECMKMEIGDDHTQPGIEFSIRDQPGNHPRRHEMRAEDHIRTKFLNQIDERQSLGQIDQQTPLVGHPRVIACFIPPSQKLRQHGREFFIERGVKLLVKDICVVERVIRENLIHIAPAPHGARESIGRFHMSGTNRGR